MQRSNAFRRIDIDEKEPSTGVDPDLASGEQDQSPAGDWRGLVARIQAGDGLAMEELYQIFSRGIRFHLWHQVGPREIDDKVHDTFLIVLEAIRRGELRDPDRLMGFVRTIVRRQVAAYIDALVQNRKATGGTPDDRIPDSSLNAEEYLAVRQKIDLMKSVLRELSERDRQILMRFYIYEQTQEQICQEMQMTETQFRLLKSRAKSRFATLGRRKLGHSNLANLSVRISTRHAH